MGNLLNWERDDQIRYKKNQISNLNHSISWREERIDMLKQDLKRKPSRIRQINDYLRQIKEAKHTIKQLEYELLWDGNEEL